MVSMLNEHVCICCVLCTIFMCMYGEYAHMYLYMHLYVYCIHVCMCMCMCVCVCMYVSMYAYIHELLYVEDGQTRTDMSTYPMLGTTDRQTKTDRHGQT